MTKRTVFSACHPGKLSLAIVSAGFRANSYHENTAQKTHQGFFETAPIASSFNTAVCKTGFLSVAVCSDLYGRECLGEWNLPKRSLVVNIYL